MKGAKPIPTRLKILRGNPGRRPLNLDEPTPPPLAEDVPPELDGDTYAIAEWQRLVPGLVACGQVTISDRALLLGYCVKYAQWVRLEENAREESLIVERSNGSPMINPTIRHANATLELLIRAAAELGLTPTSRSRVTRTPVAAARSKWVGALP